MINVASDDIIWSPRRAPKRCVRSPSLETRQPPVDAHYHLTVLFYGSVKPVDLDLVLRLCYYIVI